MGLDHHRLRSAQLAGVAASPAANGSRLMAMLSKFARHARACRGHPRLAFLTRCQDVDGRDMSAFTRVFRRAMPGHDVEGVDHDTNIASPLLVVTIALTATWDAWRWYVLRVWDSPEEAASLVLTVVFLGALG